MFTGIIEEIGVLRDVRKGKDSAQLVIGAEKVPAGIRVGDSVAVNGVCLTAVRYTSREFTVDVMAETLNKTNLRALKIGDGVNLERALRVGDRLGGHLVSGHIDGVGEIISLERHDIALILTVKASSEVMRYIIKKGSVAVDGVSLTVADFSSDRFRVSLIPHTAHLTVLGVKKVGDTVNLEGDIIGKYVEKLMGFNKGNAAGSGLNMDFLAEHGFK